MSGKIRSEIAKLTIRKKEIVAAFTILEVAEIGDTLRKVKTKLPAWIENKNDILRIFGKLVNIGIIRIEETSNGAKIEWIAEEAVDEAESFDNNISTYQNWLNNFAFRIN